MNHLLTEPDGSASWRKIITMVMLILFVQAVEMWLFKHADIELPQAYMIIIITVFLSYFGKKAIDRIGTRNKPAEQ